MKFLIPSYGRAETIATVNTLENLGISQQSIYVGVQTKEDLKAYRVPCKVVYGEAQNVAANRNNLLKLLEPGERAVFLDDDVTGFIKLTKKHSSKPVKEKLTVAGFRVLLECGFLLGGIFGVQNTDNKIRMYKQVENEGVVRVCVLLNGGFLGFTQGSLVFDESLPAGEDYEACANAITRGVNTFRLLRYALYTRKQGCQQGGCGCYKENKLIYHEKLKTIVQRYPGLISFTTNKPDCTTLQCRGGCFVIIKHDYGSPRWSGEVSDCSLPMTFDTYSNCAFGCVYCFSQYQRGIGGSKESYYAKDVRSVNVQKVKDIFTGAKKSQFYPYIQAKKTMQWGGLSDQFDNFERKYGVTLELLKFFKEIDYPLTFSTKATWWLNDKRYTDLFKGQKNWNCKFSIITLDKKAAQKVEKGCPSPQERLQAMEKFADLDAGGATLRLRPFIIGLSSRDYENLILKSVQAGATAMTTEFFCLERRSVKLAKQNYKAISDVIGFDVVDFYVKHSKGSGYLRLNRKIKEPYVKRMQEIAHANNMRFYVSDAHFKEACDNACCCALPDDWNISRCQFSQALQICKRNGKVTWNEIEPEGEHLNFMWSKAEGYNQNNVNRRAKFNGMTMREYLQYLWNNPKAGQSPYKMFGGVMKPNGFDENGDVIYTYDQTRTFIEQGE